MRVVCVLRAELNLLINPRQNIIISLLNVTPIEHACMDI